MFNEKKYGIRERKNKASTKMPSKINIGRSDLT
jgi:hypothetical protein